MKTRVNGLEPSMIEDDTYRMEGEEAPVQYGFSLYLYGKSLLMQTALGNAEAILNSHLTGCFRLEVVDLAAHPERMARDRVVAVPHLVRNFPLPIRRIVGDFSDGEAVLKGLSLPGPTAGQPPGSRDPTEKKS